MIVTTGIARRWFQDDLITGRDTADRGRDPSDLGGAGALPRAGKAGGCRFIWLSATVDPAFYARYLDSAEVLQTLRLRSGAQGAGQVLPADSRDEFLNERYIRHVIKERRGVAVFVPTRAEVEQLAGTWARSGSGSPPRSTTAASRSGSSGRSWRARSSGRSSWR